MSNRSYLSVWCADFPEDKMPERFGKFLSTVPFSASQPGFTHLTVRAVDSSESPFYEQDLRSTPLDADAIVELVEASNKSDCSYQVGTRWDLSVFESASNVWKVEAQPLAISCYGEDYDGGIWQTEGHFQVDLGFEHHFTGHAGLLGIKKGQREAPQSAEEARFLEAMAWPENLERYQKETRENIQHLFTWVGRIQKALPIQTLNLWSEGENNFEARLEEILAVR